MRTVKAYDIRNRCVLTLRPDEARLLVAYDVGEWRGKKGESVRLHCTKAQLIEFVRLMRFRDRPMATGIDSRTHRNLGGIRGYQHVRNLSYTPLADELMSTVSSSTDYAEDPLETLWREVEKELSLAA